MKTLYGVSGLVMGTKQVRHIAFLVEASSMAEAYGLGHALTLKMYPVKDGWYNHHVVTSNAEPNTLENTFDAGDYVIK